MSKILENRVIFVTGAAGGIGQGISKAVLESGGCVAMGDLDQAVLDQAQELLTNENSISSERVFTVLVDVTDEISVTSALEATTSRFGQLDGLVNNAGVIRLGENKNASLDDWRIQLEVNVLAVHICCNVFAALLGAANRVGAIVNIASNAGKVGYPNMAGYNASKAAVINLTRTLSAEWAGQQINVNAICPGGVFTPMLQEVANSIGERTGEDPAELVKTMVPAQLGRHIEPIEVGRVAVFLLSDDSRIIRGQSINVDGGDTPY
jgi:NAD(P)-dependent dehydrogenase (short-subunit alcohol dehydrogenase family)